MNENVLLRSGLAGALALGAGLVLAGAALAAEDAKVIKLTQEPCQFIEPEGVDRGYSSTEKADCVAINDETGERRVAEAETLTLTPGKYIFRVENRNVPYDLGFWVRGDGLIARARLPSTSGGGLGTGQTRDYEIELEPGDYVYSCPLNNTPDYKLVVREES